MAYFNESEKSLLPKEIKFLKQGVVFKHLKVFALKMRQDELFEREYWIKKSDFTIMRPRSGDSMTTIKSIITKKEKPKDDNAAMSHIASPR